MVLWRGISSPSLAGNHNVRREISEFGRLGPAGCVCVIDFVICAFIALWLLPCASSWLSASLICLCVSVCVSFSVGLFHPHSRSVSLSLTVSYKISICFTVFFSEATRSSQRDHILQLTYTSIIHTNKPHHCFQIQRGSRPSSDAFRGQSLFACVLSTLRRSRGSC